MPFDTADFRVLTPEQEADLALLRKVRDAMSKRDSWIKNARADSYGRHCVSGWIETFDARREMQMMQIIAPLIRSHGLPGDPRNRVIAFNDRRSTRKIDIVRLLDRAITALERGDG